MLILVPPLPAPWGIMKIPMLPTSAPWRIWPLALSLGTLLAASTPALDRVTLQLKWHHQFQFAGYYAAQEQGYYRDAGLEVTLVEGQPGTDVPRKVVSGEVQYGVGSTYLMVSRQLGMPVVVLGVVFQHSPEILMARARSGIATAQDLVGKRVMLEDKTDELTAYLKQEGVSEKSLKLVPHSFDPKDLVLGKVDAISAYSTDEPFFMKTARQEFVELSPRMGGIDFYGDNLFTSEAEFRSHPGRPKAFLEASMKGWKYAMLHPEEMTELILSRYGEGRGRAYLLFEAQRMVPLLQAGTVEPGYMYRGRWQHIADTYAGLGLLRKDFPLDGFLYDPAVKTRQDQSRLLLALAGLTALGIILGGTSLAFFRLNLRLKKETATRLAVMEEKARLESQMHHDQKMKSLGVLAGGIAHDMNNVLGAILGFAESSLEDQPPGTRLHRALTTIAKAATRGGNLVKSLLSFARQSPAEEREVDVNALLREEVQLLSRTTLAKVELAMDLDPGLHPVLGDSNALTNAFMNLCVNAVDAMDGQGRITLRTCNEGDGAVVVQVQDTGTGMTREVLDRALDPFFTTKPEGMGTGLGLTLVYGVVKAHKGQIELQSEVGAGTTVTLRFPASRHGPAGAAPEPAPAPPGPRRALRVLVVDDDEDYQLSIGAMLEALGHHATAAPSGEASLALVAEGFRPDVVVLDLNMPGLGGAETLPLLRHRLPGVPVVIATGRADQAANDLAGAYPLVALMPKPFSMKELQKQLAEADTPDRV